MSEMPNKTLLQAQMLGNRLIKRDRHIGKWARRTHTNAYRVYDRDIPEIPLLIERYDDALYVSYYERSWEIDAQFEADWLQAMLDAASNALTVPPEHVFLRRRKRQRGLEQYEKLSNKMAQRIVLEHGTKFLVNLTDWLDTGLFLDHRQTRARVREAASGKTLLNLFAYTSAFSVQAAVNPRAPAAVNPKAPAAVNPCALSTDSVDLSNTWLDIAEENFRLNGIKTQKIDAQDYLQSRKSGTTKDGQALAAHRLVRADALKFIHYAKEAGLSWDIIVLDPPSFSNSSAMDGSLDICRDSKPLLSATLALLKPGGELWFSTNARRFNFPYSDFPQFQIKDLSKSSLDVDIGKNIPRQLFRIFS